MCVTSSVLSGCVPLLDSFACTTPGILTWAICRCMALYVCRCKCVSACVSHVSRFVALLKLDQRCCTMHSFNFFVMNVFLSSSYQLQYCLSGWMYRICSSFSFRSHCYSSSSCWNVFYLTWKEYFYSYCAFRSLSCAFDRSLKFDSNTGNMKWCWLKTWTVAF